MRGTRPAAVCNHPRKPGTFSVISPPPAEVGGPQQGGLSVVPSLELLQTVGTFFLSASVMTLMDFIFMMTLHLYYLQHATLFSCSTPQQPVVARALFKSPNDLITVSRSKEVMEENSRSILSAM